MIKTRLGILLSMLATSSCMTRHVQPHTPRERHYDPNDYGNKSQPVSEGSLWTEGSRSLFGDFRASQVGDVVTVRVDENPQANGDASTDVSRASEHSLGAPNMLGFMAALSRAHPDISPSTLISIMGESSFSGSGQTTRASRVRANITVQVRQVMPNDDLFVEGQKIMMVNDEELHIYVSGVIRPQDIEQDNSVGSSKIADAQIEFTGRGVLTEGQRQGWLSRLLNKASPI